VPTDRLYALQYIVSFAINRKEIVFDVKSVLFARGVVSDYKKFSDPYAGAFFCDRLLARVESTLKERSGSAGWSGRK
jgi:hypothetical protein